MTFAYAGSGEVIADLTSHQLGVVGEGIQGQRHRKGLLYLHGTVGTSQEDPVESASVQGDSKHRGAAATSFQQTEIRKVNFNQAAHQESLVTSQAWRT